MINIIQHKKIWLTISAVLVLASIIGFFAIGLRYGIDFTGGTLIEIEFGKERPAVAEFFSAIQELKITPIVQPVGEKEVLLRFQEIDEQTHKEILIKLKDRFGEFTENRFESIGPVLGRELASKTIFAIIIACLAIILYIAFAFRRVSRPVASWKYGTIAVIALIHDLAILTGLFVLFGLVFKTEVNSPFVAALLTTLGYSVNDTIVIFDRIRERLPRSSDSFDNTVNQSINQTLARSIFTTLTTVLVILPVYFFGGSTIKDFALALAIGIAIGAYSSIFVASPLLVWWQKRR